MKCKLLQPFWKAFWWYWLHFEIFMPFNEQSYPKTSSKSNKSSGQGLLAMQQCFQRQKYRTRSQSSPVGRWGVYYAAIKKDATYAIWIFFISLLLLLEPAFLSAHLAVYFPQVPGQPWVSLSTHTSTPVRDSQPLKQLKKGDHLKSQLSQETQSF